MVDGDAAIPNVVRNGRHPESATCWPNSYVRLSQRTDPLLRSITVDLPSGLAAHLRDLAERLDAGDSLSASLVTLVADLRTAVPSYQGLRLTLVLQGCRSP